MAIDALLPQAMGPYLLLEQLDTAGGVVVWRGHDPERDLAVVLTTVTLSPAVPEEQKAAFSARFLERARRAAALTHLNLAATLDFGEDERTGAFFVAQEENAGRTLHDRPSSGQPRPWDEALAIVAGVGRALRELHGAGLVHGDVQPRTILLTDPGVPKLLDGGFDRADASSVATANAALPLRAPLYASPEQAVGENVDARTDIFALGAVAYRLLTGREAFAAEDTHKILARVIHDRPPSASSIVPGLPLGVDELLAKALAKARKDRYDALAFVDDIDDLLAGRPPRHARESAAKLDTARLSVTEGSSAPEAAGLASARLVRRSLTRGVVGLAALALVAGLEVLRRTLDSPASPPAGPPEVEPARREVDGGPTPVPGLPSRDAEIARLSIDFRHTLEKGTVIVLVDGSPVLERRIRGAVKKSLLGIKLREGRLLQSVEVPPGRHEIAVRVLWADDQRTDTITGDFTAGGTRRLSATLGRIGKQLSVTWE